ncbi:hypothetical protein C8J56DRAFT_890006 [Mycena floridula]|nr:hypothetical protein C8J56DRAFT_890006 [Mycena floridula]
MTLRQLFNLARTVSWTRQYSAAPSYVNFVTLLAKATKERRALWLHRMPTDTRGKEIRLRFKRYGKIERIMIYPPAESVDNDDTGHARGQGVVIFQFPDVAERVFDICAVAKDPILIDSCPVEMKVMDTEVMDTVKDGAGGVRVTGKKRTLRKGMECPDALHLTPIPSGLEEAKIYELLAPYVHHRRGLSRGLVYFAPGSRMYDFISNCDGVHNFEGIDARLEAVHSPGKLDGIHQP